MKLPREELDSTCLELTRAIQGCGSGSSWPMNARDQLVIVRDEKWAAWWPCSRAWSQALVEICAQSVLRGERTLSAARQYLNEIQTGAIDWPSGESSLCVGLPAPGG